MNVGTMNIRLLQQLVQDSSVTALKKVLDVFPNAQNRIGKFNLLVIVQETVDPGNI